MELAKLQYCRVCRPGTVGHRGGYLHGLIGGLASRRIRHAVTSFSNRRVITDAATAAVLFVPPTLCDVAAASFEVIGVQHTQGDSDVILFRIYAS